MNVSTKNFEENYLNNIKANKMVIFLTQDFSDH